MSSNAHFTHKLQDTKTKFSLKFFELTNINLGNLWFLPIYWLCNV